MIVLDGVSKRYNGHTVLDEVSIAFGAEGVTALIGPNGAGKSTLFGVVGRLIRPEAGSVAVDGSDVATARSSDLAKTLAVLRQDNHIAARLTVHDLVEFGRFPHSKGRLTVTDRDHVDRAIDYLELDDFRNRFLDELSGGQRQRAFIAMVLAQDTKYILLDEPLNNLDLRHMTEIMKLLRRMADELGKRVIVVLHDINFAATYSDRIVAIRDGRVVADAAAAEIMRPEVLEAVYDTKVDVRQIDGRPVALYYS
ncbi:iron ABC transporter ATP-binding protein [Cryobacterium sp. LW097]|uniref:iron ABC transporter ATP-binding protein n=1 Tax=unclassified Cryobacterium TaxID=2649013 RepID=UPI000B4D33EB|nr:MULTISPECIES: ATP-binding cassette domain-containing protein [unclassified Cryobacterium]ASD21062.1 iron ABC transporter ATP-binding protein [Cryobacterium sp. LW097]TFC56795.1 ATP-binding cassette domain-containing protein [Cryobacterium sp. TMB3-1-2]TFC61664.1 ATP-binding cassette domain-containing protein [Cryobacterium sp. TMB1-7]TFC67142.1 ATP-binding cassette domain-containing protein [Cryobacterium sp. TMB3-15]TFC73345.1 ATP-binding cassette domain-containing protein [Cryobacterium s